MATPWDDPFMVVAILFGIAVASSLAFNRISLLLKAHSRWIGATLPYEVQLLGRLPDGETIDDKIRGTPIQVNLHTEELAQYLEEAKRFAKEPQETEEGQPLAKKDEVIAKKQAQPNRSLREIASEVTVSYAYARRVWAEHQRATNSNSKDTTGGNKVTPEVTLPVSFIPYAIGNNRIVVQFNHTQGTLDQYAFGASIEAVRDIARGGSKPLMIVAGFLYPYPQKVSIPGGLKEAVFGRFRDIEDVELLFFDPIDITAERITTTHLSEEERSDLAQFITFSAQYANIHGLHHVNERLRDEITALNKRTSLDRDTIKDLHSQVSRLRKQLPIGVRPMQAADFLLPMTFSFFVLLILGLGTTSIIGFIWFAKDAAMIGGLLILGGIGGGSFGLLLNYLRYAKS